MVGRGWINKCSSSWRCDLLIVVVCDDLSKCEGVLKGSFDKTIVTISNAGIQYKKNLYILLKTHR